jgi:glutaredoxin-like protein NrdH
LSVTVYTKSGCSACRATAIYLRRHGIEFTEIDLDNDDGARAEIARMGYTSAPVVVAGEVHWSGFREERLRGLGALR